MGFSLWWDEGGNMLWLDGASEGAGPCNDTEGSPDNILKVQPDPVVTFSNIKWGEIGSTFDQANATWSPQAAAASRRWRSYPIRL